MIVRLVALAHANPFVLPPALRDAAGNEYPVSPETLAAARARFPRLVAEGQAEVRLAFPDYTGRPDGLALRLNPGSANPFAPAMDIMLPAVEGTDATHTSTSGRTDPDLPGAGHSPAGGDIAPGGNNREPGRRHAGIRRAPVRRAGVGAAALRPLLRRQRRRGVWRPVLRARRGQLVLRRRRGLPGGAVVLLCCCGCEGGCGPSAVCGDGACNGGETCASCPRDCGPCCGNGRCEPGYGENPSTCYRDCGRCGDGICTVGHENASRATRTAAHVVTGFAPPGMRMPLRATPTAARAATECAPLARGCQLVLRRLRFLWRRGVHRQSRG
ncbi:MAG: hypothetical protein M5R40_07315 [Anaerolineae bacterium]|nr:hypothetical protein [Anaerolineae bacterium]